ncbi:histone deacetylase family protein [Rhodopila globiformis]|uniref:Acetoin utilization protein n=1 Tax=Rhodopila globiformis TaxID=1071 RepID=A0A2S6N0Z6_RHOGL|nr:histone deacetylase family protein [Rhodopila globiformis]PPQ28269.1 acetoin utilization protein [Rhodopila globiformis]
MATALITHPACLEHDTGPYHPETSERLRTVLAALETEEFAMLLRESAPEASVEQLTRVHPRDYVEAILAIHPDLGEPINLDSDTVMSAGSAEAAARAAGGACLGVDAVMEGWARTAFAAVRPPGHHAEPNKPMGFCLFNNAAVAALHAREKHGVARIAVVDFDVHHGNGTQAMFAADPGLFYASSHQNPCYPGTGEVWERGVADNILNVPLRPRDGSTQFRAVWSETIIPALDTFAPGLLIVSAGFDAHVADPLAQLRLETADFAWVTDRLLEVADRHCGGRLVSVLEGGYDLNALAASVAAHVRSLMRG